jgi:uncharacterized protein
MWGMCHVTTAPAPHLTLAWWRLALTLWLVVQMTGCAVVDYEQRRWIFQPITDRWLPAEAAARGMQDVWIDYRSSHPEQVGQDVRLHGLWLPQPAPSAPVLLFLHGVRWDVRASAPRMRQLHELGFSVLGIDYRGFGRSSEAMPSEELVAEDARQAWAWLAREHQQAARYIFGHSLGGNIAVRLAHEVQGEAGLIVEGAFTSTGELFRSTSWGWLPITGLITQHFDAGSRIAHIGTPVLVVHAAQDTMIAPAQGRALFDKARPPKRFLLVEGAVHENTGAVGAAAYREALRALFGL